MKNIFYLLFVLPLLFSCGDDPIVGESADNYFKMDQQCGCDSPNGDDKKEVVFNENYLNKWVTFSGIVETVDGNSLGVNCDLEGTDDINIEFEDEKDIFDLQKGSIVKVKFAMRELGGCLLPYYGDNGKIIQKDMDMSELKNEMFE